MIRRHLARQCLSNTGPVSPNDRANQKRPYPCGSGIVGKGESRLRQAGALCDAFTQSARCRRESSRGGRPGLGSKAPLTVAGQRRTPHPWDGPPASPLCPGIRAMGTSTGQSKLPRHHNKPARFCQMGRGLGAIQVGSEEMPTVWGDGGLADLTAKVPSYRV